MKKESQRLTSEENNKLRNVDFEKAPGYVRAESILSVEFGERGSAERDEFNAKARAWYYGEVLRDRRKQLGEDIFALPLQINKLCPDYKLYLRRYPYVPAWDLNLICI